MSVHDLVPVFGPDAAAARSAAATRPAPSASDVLAASSAARLVSTPPAPAAPTPATPVAAADQDRTPAAPHADAHAEMPTDAHTDA